MLCREVGDTFQSPVQGSTGPSKVYGATYVPQQRWNSRVFPAQAHEQRTQNVPNPGKKRLRSWVLNHHLRKVRRLQHFPAYTRRLPNLRIQLSSLKFSAHLPPMPWHQKTRATSQVLLEELVAGLGPSTVHHQTQWRILMAGSLPTWWRRMSYQVGGQSSSPSAIRVSGLQWCPSTRIS